MDDTQCSVPGKPGICVPGENVCAVPDAACPSGYRYDATSGKEGCVSLAGTDMSISDGAVPPDLSGPLIWNKETSTTTAELLGVWGTSDGAPMFM
jgi:hypothetical protein